MPGARFFPDARLNFAENLLRRRDESAGDRLSRRGGAAPDADRGASCTARSSAFAGGAAQRGRRRRATASPATCRTCRRAIVAALGAAADRRRLVVVLAGLRRPGRARSLRPDRAGRARGRRRLLVRRQDARLPRARLAGDLRARCPASDAWSSSRTSMHSPAIATPRSRRRCGTSSCDSGAGTTSPFERFPFDHPLYILYSSGTTGVPKCIVHGAGGTLLQHLKEHQLHCDIQRRRPRVLLHDLRLDDVELARDRARLRGDAAALRRLAGASGRRARCSISRTRPG